MELYRGVGAAVRPHLIMGGNFDRGAFLVLWDQLRSLAFVFLIILLNNDKIFLFDIHSF